MPIDRWSGLSIPSLSTLRTINNNFEKMLVKVAPVPGKGLGLIAQQDIEKDVPFAYYLVKLYPSKSLYCSSRYLVGAGRTRYVFNLFDRSFPPPEDLIPYVGPLANEPTGVDGEPNCYLQDPPQSEDSRICRLTLRTTRRVSRGEELVLDYGPGYGERPYPSKHNKKQ